MSAKYLSCAETAKLVRKALKDAFPGVKFYVNSSTYAGGASIDVRWVDGPTTKEVDQVVKTFEGKSFDGMIDMGCYWRHWMLPDGSVELANGPGTAGSMGTISSVDNPKPHPDAELVRFGANYIQAHRVHTRQLLEKVAQAVSNETGWDKPEILDTTSYLTRTRDVPSAYFKRDWTIQVPGTTGQELEQFYNRRLWKFSDYQRAA